MQSYELQRTWTDADGRTFGRDERGNIHEVIDGGTVRVFPHTYWTLHGHHLLGQDEYQSCIQCGGLWAEIQPDDDDPTFGKLVDLYGNEATECEGTSALHGEDFTDQESTNNCNCLICNN